MMVRHMINKLVIKEHTKLHQLLGYGEVELKDLTILMGPNGVGKSSLLQGLSSKYEEHGANGYYGDCGSSIEVISDAEYQIETLKARKDNGKYRGYFSDDMTLDLKAMFQSEGQSTMTVFYSRVEKLINDLVKDDSKKITFLIDELDSGTSFDNILTMTTFLKNMRKKFPQLQIIMTAHNYEFARVFPENTLWVPSGKYMDMSEYITYQELYRIHLMLKLAEQRSSQPEKKG
jgi:predicted ATPase